ncbi:MAG: tRNA-binding protein [Bacteroidota bacterium]
MKELTWKQFEAVDLRIGTILTATSFPEARKPAYKLRVDFGTEIGIKNSSAQITEAYELNDLPGKQVLGVVNFPPKQIGPFISECLITGFHTEGGVILASVDQKVPNGTKLL